MADAPLQGPRSRQRLNSPSSPATTPLVAGEERPEPERAPIPAPDPVTEVIGAIGAVIALAALILDLIAGLGFIRF